jgi:hypothetical protein
VAGTLLSRAWLLSLGLTSRPQPRVSYLQRPAQDDPRNFKCIKNFVFMRAEIVYGGVGGGGGEKEQVGAGNSARGKIGKV